MRWLSEPNIGVALQGLPRILRRIPLQELQGLTMSIETKRLMLNEVFKFLQFLHAPSCLEI